MKTAQYLLLACCLFLASCHQAEEDFYTTAELSLIMPEGIQPEQIQGTLTLQNLNTLQTTSTSELTANGFTLQILRGAYKADVEGMIRYRDQNSQSHTAHFRAHSDYVALSTLPLAKVELQMTLLDP